jgi:mannose-6-phosphate isomerase-like protein (cupin superfamily)
MSYPDYVDLMRYPPARYHADVGEASAVRRPADHEPELSRPGGSAVHYLAVGSASNGEFGLYRWEMGPDPSGPGPHFHKTISESFYVLTGTIRIYDGTRWVDNGPGDFVYVPEGGLHGFRNESGEPASMVLLFTPSAPREAYFETLFGVGEKLVRDMTEDERLVLYLRHDNYWVDE